MNAKTLEWVLRVSVAGEFIGHGALALGGKPDWVKWIQQFGVADASMAGQLLWLIGLMDVLLAILILIKPIRLVLLWMAFWGFFTALVRPLVGVGWLDFFERWTNWGAPLALLLFFGWPKHFKEWLRW